MANWNIDAPSTEYYDHQTPGLENVIREVLAAPEVAIDSETTGLVLWKDVPLYWSLAFGSRRMTLNISALHRFKEAFADPTKHWIFANAKFDTHMFANVGVHIAGKLVDTCVMHALLYEEKPHGLKDMNLHLFNWKWQDFQDTFGKISKDNSPETIIRKAEAQNFPLLCEYAANDSWGTLQVYNELKRQLQSAPTYSLFRGHPLYIETLWDLFSKVEVPYTKVLFNVERNGVLVNQQYLHDIAPTAVAEIEGIERSIYKEAGRALNPGSTQQLAAYFFDQMQVKPLKMTKGGKTGVKKPSVDEGFLSHYKDQIPMAKLVLRHRELKKLHGTYIVGLQEQMDPFGRIHTRFNQDVARCMPAGELVLTSRGYLPIEQVAVGLQVISHTGVPQKVVECSSHAPKPIYRVTLSNGLELRTTGNHQYRTGSGWTKAEELKLGTKVAVHSDAEQWRPVKDWHPFEVSSWGRVRNSSTGRIRAVQPKGDWGHLKVSLARNGAQERGDDYKDFSVHRLVLGAFDSEGAGETRHLNGIAWDNTISNLCYGTSSANTQDALRHGTLSQRRAGRTVLTEADVAAIRATPRLGQPPPTSSKFSYEIAEAIRVRAAAGESQKSLAVEFETSIASINNIVRRKTWANAAPSAKSAAELAEQYGVSAGHIREIWSGAKWQPEDYIEGSFAQFYEALVVDVVVETPEVTFGLTVEEDHSHVTGGIVTHNTGRLSSSQPNMQNIPRTENDKWKLRGAFIAAPNCELIVADYEQLEMRLLACASLEQGMIDVINKGWDIHMGNASMIFGIPYDEIKQAKGIEKKVGAGELPSSALTQRVTECLSARSAAKNIGFGLIYGMGPDKLANSLNVTRAEAEVKISQFKRAYPAVDAFTREAVAETERTGYAFTILGRRRNVTEIASYRRDERSRGERLAVNTQIQGSAADVVKLAQILLFKSGIEQRFGAKQNLQVHDEIMHECPKETSREAEKEIQEWMEHPFPWDLAVPLSASINRGDSWLSAK